MTVRLKWAIALVAVALISAAGLLVWRSLFEYVSAEITYVKAPRQGVVGEPINLVVRGTWPGAGYRFHTTETTLVDDVIHIEVIGRRRSGQGSSEPTEFETYYALPDLPSMRCVLDVGNVGQLPLVIYRRGSSTAGSMKVRRPGSVDSLTCPVVVLAGRPFEVRLEGRWGEGGGELSEVNQTPVGQALCLTVVGVFSSSEQVLEPPERANFSTTATVELAEPGIHEIAAAGREWARLLVRVVDGPLPTGSVVGPIRASTVTAPVAASLGESFELVVGAHTTDSGTPRIETLGSGNALQVRPQCEWPANEQTARVGVPDELLREQVRAGVMGPLVLTFPDQPWDFTTVVDVR